MATFTRTLSNNSNYYIQLTITEILPSDYLTTNKTDVNYNLTMTKTSGTGYWDNSARNNVKVIIAGSTIVNKNIAYDFRGSTPKTIVLASGKVTGIEHNTDGTKTIAVSGSFSDPTGDLGSATASGNVVLTNIPRYTNVTSWTVTSKTETSVTLSWRTSDICSYIRYGTSTASYTEKSVNSNSGTVTITNLNADTNYTFYLLPKRKDNNLWGDGSANRWKTTTQRTYPYPTIIGIGSDPLIIGNSQTLTLNNPLSRTVTIKMYKDNTSGTELYSGTTNSNKITFTPNSTTLYNSIPSSSTGNAVYTCTYSVSTHTTGAYIYKIRGDEYPTFSASDWSYTADKTNLTNNNQTIINKYSTITINVNNAATSNYGATISKYILKWGTTTNETNTTSGTITNGSGQILTVIAVDSRSLSKETSKTVSDANYVNYTVPVIDDISTDRDNGIEAGVKLSFSGTMFNSNFGSEGTPNTLTYAKYYVSTDNYNWSSAYPSDNSMLNAITRSGNSFNLSDFVIHANGSSGGFTVGTKYYIKIYLTDSIIDSSTIAIKYSIIPDGKVARTVYQDSEGEYHEGINGLPDANYTQIIHGNLKVEGGYEIYSTSEQKIGTWIDGKPLYRKVFETSGQLTTNELILATLTNEVVKKIEGFLFKDNGFCQPYGSWDSNDTTRTTRCFSDGNYIKVQQNSS